MVWTIVFMMVVGALIGGMTNSLAIKMLFRPYQAKMIGKWRIPFTPGLIPKRHHELAQQLGEMVVQYLLTAEGLGKKLKSKSFHTGLTTWIQEEVRRFLSSQTKVTEVVEKQLGIESPKAKAIEKMDNFLSKGYDAFWEGNQKRAIAEIVPQHFQDKVEESIPKATDFIILRLKELIESPEGKEQLSVMVERFLLNKGTLGNMLSMFLGNERLVDKIQPQVLKILADEHTKQLIEDTLQKEWVKCKQRKLEEFTEFVEKEKIISTISAFSQNQIPLFKWFDQSIDSVTKDYQAYLIENLVPKTVQNIIDLLMKHLTSLLKSLQLEKIVKEQVEPFSVERLEELVLTISKREFKMITYLGALLGGLIGLIQGLIVFFVV